MSKVQKSPYTGKYQVDNRVLVNDGGQYASNRGLVVEVKPGKPSHNYRVTFDVFGRGIWFSEGELLPDEPTAPATKTHPDPTAEFGTSGLGIGGINDDQSMPVIPSVESIARVQRLHDTDVVCRKCGASQNFGGAMFTTAGWLDICDDCA